MSTNINLKNSTDTTFSITHSDGANTKVLDSKDIAVAIDTVADFPANPNNGDVVIVRDLNRGGTFIYDSSEVAGSNNGTNFDGWIRQYEGSVNVKWFGAVGDGIVDDTNAILRAVANGGEITGDGVYKTTAEIALNGNTYFKNVKFVSTANKVFTATGEAVGFIPLTADLNYKGFSCTVSSATTFVVDGWAFLKSNADWSISDGVKLGEYVKIKAIDGNILYFYDAVIGDYLTADSATISPINTVKDIEFDNCEINGDVTIDNQICFEFNMCEDVRIHTPKTKNFDYIHISFIRCVNYELVGGEASKTGTQEGLDYGVGHQKGCYNGKVIGFTGNSMRHISTIGGSEGVSRHINVQHCFGYNLTDAGIDAHSAVYEHEFSNNILSFSDDADTSIDGIISNGARPMIANNQITNCKRHGVMWQPTIVDVTAQIKGQFVSNDLIGNKLSLSTSGVVVANSTTAGETRVDGVIISGVDITDFDVGVTIQANIAPINNVIINGVNTSDDTGVRGIYIDADTNDINNVIINGCNIENVSNESVYFGGSASFGAKDVNVSGNIIKGGNYGIRGTNVVGGKIENNYIKGYSSAKMLFDALSNVAIDKGITKIQTGSAIYTVLTHETDFIYNRAETATLTLPDATVNEDMEIRLKTLRAFAVNSANTDVVPIASTTAGTAILTATAGAWCTLKSNGTHWVVMQQG